MNEVAFVKKREVDWQRIGQLCDHAENSLTKLRAEEFHEFVRLYRRVSADLALARTRSNNIQLINYLNDLVARAYGIFYRTPRPSFLTSIWQAIQLAAQTVRRCKAYILASVLIFAGSAFFSYFVMDLQPQTHDAFVPPAARDNFEAWKSGRFEERDAQQSTMMTGFYMSHNPVVAVLGGAMAASTFGLGTVWSLYENGSQLGALAHELRPNGLIGHMFISITPHGVTEMSGCIVASSAGLLMGFVLISPGRRKRGEALRVAGKDALVLLTTGSLMMFMAAPIEGFFSFNPRVPDAAKIFFACASAVAWAMFWLFVGKSSEPAAAE